ncbi:MAG: VOC family protein [Candidatus Latescibacteria bacterium]|jgi:predicted enzyme related to lactoylglutathione lyase|nr:VOC family protein [Candidatus Latescibacterota bacterium]
MIKHVAFFGIPVSDVAKSREFYEGKLGLTVTMNFQDRWVEYDIGETTIAISDMAEGSQPGAPGGFVALEVSDLDAAVAELKAQGVPIFKDIFESPVCRMAVIGDPDNNGIILHQLKEGEG